MNHYLGIDFGTSNTHVAYCDSQDSGKLNPVAIKIGGKASTTTCVLWRLPGLDEKDVLAFGTVAMEEWSQLEADERATCRFAFGFKPDLVRSENARRDAVAFLRKISQAVSEVFPRIITQGTVVVGVPAEIGNDHVARTLEVAQAAGFVNVECVAEPLGALAYHLNNGSVSYVEARQGVIVVDFGGGTFDVALVDPGGLREPWGDPLLGGRLFDDLFYQWIQDQNDPFMIDHREAMVVWQKECRELKEAFSRHWKVQGDSMDKFKYSILVGDVKKWLRKASVAEFENRARNYRPSPVVLDYFRPFGIPPELASETPINMYEWIRNTLVHNKSGDRLAGKYHTVILTGGSSEWPFMRTLAAEVFQIDPEQNIRKSDDPETTIGSGLALYTLLRSRLQRRRETLRSDQEQYRERFVQSVAQRLDKFADDAAGAVVAAIMPRIDTIFWNWYDNGGSLASIEKDADAICQAFETEAVDLLAPHWAALDTDLVRALRDELTQLLQDHAVSKDLSSYLPKTFTLQSVREGAAEAGDQIAGGLADFAGIAAMLATAVVGAVIAAVKIKLVILAFVHPLVGSLLALSAVLTAIGFGKAASSYAEEYIKQIDFGSKGMSALHLAFPRGKFEQKLKVGHESARKLIRDEIAKKLGESVDVHGAKLTFIQMMGQAFEATVRQVIDDLGVLEQMATAERVKSI